MRIVLRFTIGCDPDTAWRALHSPRILGKLYAPLLQVQSLLPGPVPERWMPGDEAPVRLAVFGRIPVGTQLIRVDDRTVDEPGGRVRILRDSGIPLTGPLGGLDVWDHQMAVSPQPGRPDRTLWRERLTFDGPTAVLLWPALWATWQLRALRVRALAPRWARDPDLS
ncbi:hypothetical protein FVO59_09035 [Microbacterium esteraromaticum]|uniref:SRPBCC family protein n=1 Tax=Microbacterium esteraromaticum TaxID=57043 RepID=A0A7D8ALS7_9MICO|nr:hypothetical protein [Microbacterium esteraromaticum]QMU97348.1 hypothetical protein FVO59_09035 [Microbacterium esteraromaticum]